jgi:hypothetical protein
LRIVQQLALPDCYIAAGFIRNLVWDSLHTINTPLNDIDVVFFDKTDVDNIVSIKITDQLNKRYPDINWQVKN